MLAKGALHLPNLHYLFFAMDKRPAKGLINQYFYNNFLYLLRA